MQKSKIMKKGAVAPVLVGCLALAGIGAYFTDSDEAVNNFTMGEVSTDLLEPHWDSAAATKVTSLAELSLDPSIYNYGVNDAYVFITVEVPYANIKTAELDGTVKAAADTQLFSFGHKGEGGGEEGVNDSWVEVTSARETTYNEDGNPDSGIKSVKYVYAYAADENNLTAISKGETTDNLFDYVKVVNAVEDQGLETTAQEIKVEGYAIQTQNIVETGKYDGKNDDGTTVAADVFAVVSKANPANTKENEAKDTDIIAGNEAGATSTVTQTAADEIK